MLIKKNNYKIGDKTMETTINKTVKGSTMEQMFDNSTNFSVKYFKNMNLKAEDEWNPNKKYKYKILIRHDENTNAIELLENEIKSIEKSKP